MKFVKTFDVHRGGRKSVVGSLVIRDGKLFIKINDNTIHFKQIGRTEDGIGVIVEKDKTKRKTKWISSVFRYNKDDIPENFQGKGYRFSIPANKLSETEYEFKFCNAKMMNKK